MTQKIKQKLYVLDTNVLLHNPTAPFQFEGVRIGIPAIVLEELDQFKRESTDRGRNAREAIRQLDALRNKGSLGEGVELDNGSVVQVLFRQDDVKLPFAFVNGDNELLSTMIAYKNRGYDVQFISKDLNARVKADALRIPTIDFQAENITKEEFYQGWVRVQVPSVQFKSEFPPILDEMAKEGILELNQFVLVEARHNPHQFRVFCYMGGKKFRAVNEPHLQWPLRPKNPQQLMALDLLLNENIQFVALLGPAGTGKTFLALLAGLHKVLVENVYEKMLISRPVVPLGRDIGYLPGDIKEKLHSWMLPIYDNMEFIVHTVNMDRHLQRIETDEHHDHYDEHRDKKSKHKHKKEKHSRGAIMPLDELAYRGKVSLEAITYMRGRSIPYQYILIDEAQNLTPHEVKTIVTRVGQGSKIILAGDPYQIDSPYLDFASNGLVVTSERFKGQGIFGTVFLETSERSELSKLAGELL
jgi:PhoH-like ATPase